MVLRTFTYYQNGKKTKISVKVCDTILSKFLGLMFRFNSPSLLFVFRKEQTLSIHSFFCKPFKAIWLDENKKVTKITDAKPNRPNYSGYGKYLLEIPFKNLPTGNKITKK